MISGDDSKEAGPNGKGTATICAAVPSLSRWIYREVSVRIDIP
jgi:hypothetical protein